MGKVKGLTQGNNSSDSKSSHTAPPPRPDPPKARLPDPTPPPVKRPRPGPSPSQQPRQIAPSQPAYSQEQDDDIQEVAPIVKSEPTSHVPAEAQYQQGQGIVADPNMEYGEEYGEYEGYEEGDYDTSMMDPNMSGADGNKVCSMWKDVEIFNQHKRSCGSTPSGQYAYRMLYLLQNIQIKRQPSVS